jgi:dTDP-glucose 4,6-dehydratase
MREAFARWRPRRVLHLAAESHVDRSIHAPGDFLETNILGTASLLRAARECWAGDGSTATSGANSLFIMLSTDEVYGALEAGDPGFSVASPYAPNSPYSASKAAADHLARAWATTYGLPVVIAHATNTHGTHQHPEKLIPRAVTHAIDGREIPIFGSGRQSREWLHVDDLCDALLRISDHASPGDRIHIATGDEWENLALVQRILAELQEAGHECPAGESLVRHVADRPGHDFRYALAGGPLRERLGWRPRRTIDCSLGETIRWYLNNRDWWKDKE